MRHKGNKNEYKEQQDRELWLAYRRVFSIYGGKIRVKQLYGLVAFAPSSRFFVSDTQALRVIKKCFSTSPHMGEAGWGLAFMRRERRRMYHEICNRVCQMREANPRLSLSQAVQETIIQPAPEMYVSLRQVAAIIDQQRKMSSARLRSVIHTLPATPITHTNP